MTDDRRSGQERREEPRTPTAGRREEDAVRDYVNGLGDPVTLTLTFAPYEWRGGKCSAEPCSWCSACAVCKDFHGTTPVRGCTPGHCPYQQEPTAR